MLRRLLLTLCLLLALASAGVWVLTWRSAYYVAGHNNTDGWEAIAHRGSLQVWLYVHNARHEGPVVWSAGVSPQKLWPSWQWRVTNEGNARIIIARLPLALPTLGFGLLALWLWRRGRHGAKGKGFEVVTSPTSEGVDER